VINTTNKTIYVRIWNKNGNVYEKEIPISDMNDLVVTLDIEDEMGMIREYKQLRITDSMKKMIRGE